MHSQAIPFQDEEVRTARRDPEKRFHAMARYILSQAHLCPFLPTYLCPTMVGFDHGLKLYPPPDAIFLGDNCRAWKSRQGHTDVINTGPFNLGSQWGFHCY